jgi:hypothetical protein
MLSRISPLALLLKEDLGSATSVQGIVRSAAGASAGTAGFFGGTGAICRYGVPISGRGSGSS